MVSRVHGKKSPIPSFLPPSDLTELAAPSEDTGGGCVVRSCPSAKIYPAGSIHFPIKVKVTQSCPTL